MQGASWSNRKTRSHPGPSLRPLGAIAFLPGVQEAPSVSVVMAVFHRFVDAGGGDGPLAVVGALYPPFFLEIPDMKLQVFFRGPEIFFQFEDSNPRIH